MQVKRGELCVGVRRAVPCLSLVSVGVRKRVWGGVGVCVCVCVCGGVWVYFRAHVRTSFVCVIVCM